MKCAHLLLLVSVLWVASACQKPADTTAVKPTAPEATPGSVAGGGGGGGVAPLGPNVGGMTPVTGSESVQGAGGGGVGSAAKDMAKRTAAGAGAPAGAGQLGEDTGSE